MLEGPDEYLIGDPRSFAVNSEGAIYLLDRQVPVIRMYGSDGTFVRNVGREGGGPGEYKSPGAIAVLPDDRLIVRGDVVWAVSRDEMDVARVVRFGITKP